MLKDECEGQRFLAAARVDDGDSILPGREIGEHKHGAVAGLAGGSENSAEELGAGKRLLALGREKVWRPDGCGRARESGLIVLEGAFDTGKIRGKRGDGILFETGGIAAG